MTKLNSLLLFIAYYFIFTGSVFAQCTETAQPIPEGLSSYLVIEAQKSITGVVADDPDFFHDDLLGRSQTEIDDKKTEAISFFQTEYGVTIDSSDVVFDTTGKPVGVLRETMLNQDADLRVISAGNSFVPTGGWPTYLRRHWITITNKQGARFGGNYNGPSSGFVPFGTSVSYGEIHIIEEDDCGTTGNEFTYIYKSKQPVFPDFQDRGVLLYEVEGISGAPDAIAFARAEANGADVLVRWVIKGKS